jgi:DMSO/TMAO reductase YedYZ molybdopterin-dependent catalytic subunit
MMITDRPGQGGNTLKSWTWPQFQALPVQDITVDIHCVTRWTKLDTRWRGVSVDTLLDLVQHDAPFVLAFCDGGYTTNLPIADLTGNQAWVAFSYGGGPLEPEHGGDVPGWAGHQAGQHLDVRLTDEDGYTAERSYSLATADGEPAAITVERLEDGEVSPYLTEELRAGDELELRGPIGNLVALGYPPGRVKTERFGGK